MSDALLTLIAEWLPQQRWYPRKGDAGHGARLTIAERHELPSPDPAVTLLVLLLRVDFPSLTSPPYDVGQRLTLHVPLSFHRDSTAVPSNSEASAGAVGTGGVLGTLEEFDGWPDGRVHDGLADLVFLRAWLSMALGVPQGAADEVQIWRNPELVGGAEDTLSDIRALGAEQSNTSIVFRYEDRPLIAKFFRILQSGAHPEVEIGRALATVSGKGKFSQVPTLQVVAQQGSSGAVLCVIHNFIEGAQDGWERALATAGVSEDFTAHAELIGGALAQVHANLRESMGAHWAEKAETQAFVEVMAARLEHAWDVARPAVGPYDQKFESIVQRLRHIDRLPQFQRIHGDLHLGQLVLRESAPTPEWFILDFEGEPLRSLYERGQADIVIRDLAGMLRSFDYAGAQAAGTGAITRNEGAEWARKSSDAFILGYENGSGERTSRNSPLFMALWLDKALYEVVYELQNRPTWTWVPVKAVRDLFESMESGVDMGLNEMAPLAVNAGVLARISEGSYYAPHSVLGAHLDSDGKVTVRALRHLAESVQLVTAQGVIPMTHEYGGIWVAVIPAQEADHVPDYRLDVRYADGVHRTDDPYRYLPTVGELDMHLIAEGRHETLWTVLGAHVRHYHSELGDVSGVSFTVWAPAVQAVRVIGEFNDWDGRSNAMRSLGNSGLWELFIPGVSAGARYKFEILTESGSWLEKADPMAYGTEVPPLTASRVVDSSYSFKDDDWMAKRATIDPHNSPMSVYEVHLGSWRPGLSYEELATELVEYVRDLGFTHVELMPVSEHPFGGSWGYQVTSYYAPTSRFGHPDQFRFLVDSLHQAGIGVIMDWVPAHFPKDEWALAQFNGGAQYEHANPQLGEHPDWGTLIFDFGRNEVRNFLVANALYWIEEFHIDGLRVDAVASMLYLDYSREDGAWSPNRFGGRENLEAISFLQEMNATVYRRNPGVVTIAEESTAFPGVTAPTSEGGLGFGIKWNMGWMHDSLTYMSEDPVNRGWHHNQITFSLAYAFTENFLLPISHDEVVHGKGSLLRKMPGDRWQQLANLRAYLAFQWAHPGKQLIFMGTEFGQEAEWSEAHGLDWWLAENPGHSAIQKLVKDLNHNYTSITALSELDNTSEGFTWLNGGDTANNVVSFVRWDKAGKPLVCIVNFAGVAYEGYRIGIPAAGVWSEALNTDLAIYGGSGVSNTGTLTAEPLPWDGQENSLRLRVPPLGALYLTLADS
ncbi:1,4-alpha-glucan branching enzyme [Arthrobacter psychrolactophilus]|uniref:1,4-alpha-glucan branching enzyme GlgB n=1 Tax=Arthrobacter psychrolactophilus TaxID=92442 RepID=A0A2V5IMS3_9MICC|nr:1,4-alpha-glucan branching protein GlgB [Arthrobacter psychrolactophilus]PYI37908.1 1,4-alpha-glucan branching enzyme [Arthrobacter psychrolactophilus]